MNRLEQQGLFLRKPWLSTPLSVLICGICLTFATPMCCALFEQRASMSSKSLEPELKNLFKGGADRIELCSALSEGGLTPTPGFLQAVRKVTSPNFPIFVMIRPRGGGFLYSDLEIDIMENDIKVLKDNGANGFVLGLLTAEGEVDVENCKRLLRSAKPLPVTFHRAFDEVPFPFKALETIIQLGFDRLLTSGQAKTAEAGMEVISRLVTQSRGRIIVMPGAGVTLDNLPTISQVTQALEFHGSAKDSNVDEIYGIPVTGESVVRSMKAILSESGA